MFACKHFTSNWLQYCLWLFVSTRNGRNWHYTKTWTPSDPKDAAVDSFLFQFLVRPKAKEKHPATCHQRKHTLLLQQHVPMVESNRSPIQSLEDVVESLAPCYNLLRVTMVTILTYTRKPSRFGNATLNHPTFMDASTWQATCLAKSMMKTMHFRYRWNESSKIHMRYWHDWHDHCLWH